MLNCVLCRQKLEFKFLKKKEDTSYSIFGCRACGLWQLFPIPSQKELDLLYSNHYFKMRTDRGYDNYLSPEVESSISQTFKKNLTQLKFYAWEKKLNQESDGLSSKASLDVGCASGYFVNYMEKRGWQSEGIDIAPEMVMTAKKKGINVKEGDFLKTKYRENSYDLITLWASLEHLPDPQAFIKKLYNLLKPGGHVYISTCHLGYWARVRKENWRFLNLPEHIWFFSRKSLEKYFGVYSFRLKRAFTYGSGFTERKKAFFFYSIIKKMADFTAKYFFLGDMIVCDFVKINACQNKS